MTEPSAIQLEGSITLSDAALALKNAKQAIKAATNAVVLDLTALKAANSVVIALILELKQYAESLQKSLVVEGMTANLKSIAKAYSVESLI